MRFLLFSLFCAVAGSLFAKAPVIEPISADSSRLFRDSQGRLIERVDYVPDGLGGYRPHLRKLYSYHASNNKVAETTVQFYKAETWLNVQKSTLLYNNNGDTLSYLVQIAKGAQWENQKRVVYEYNATEISAKTLTMWEEGEWINTTRYQIQYIPSENRYAVNGEFVWMGDSWVGGKGVAIPTVDTADSKRNRQ